MFYACCQELLNIIMAKWVGILQKDDGKLGLTIRQMMAPGYQLVPTILYSEGWIKRLVRQVALRKER